MANISIDEPVPNFKFDSTNGDQSQLTDCHGHFLILYFYPKDHTSGCTRESEDFRNNYDEFQKHGAIIYGISRDSLRSHEKFIDQLKLPFHLISDKDERLCQLFAVIKPKMMYGKPARGVERSTFLIDPQGILRQEWRKVTVEGHAAEVLYSLKSRKS